MNYKKWAKFSTIAILILSIGFYASWQLRHIVTGPKLAILSPANQETVLEPLVAVTGKAKQIDWLYLNGRQIFTNEDGEFSEKILALPNYNMIQLIGKDKFGRTTTKVIEFVYNNQQQNI